MDTSHHNPFPGLRPFQTDEAHLFFGREGQSVELLRLLRQDRFVAVVGPSGSGKSSLVRAGLLPSLHAGFMRSAGSRWRVAVLRPGANPIGNLARALGDWEVLGDGRLEERDRREFMEITLRRGSLGLAEAVSEARLAEGENLLVVVDQFEEIFRFQRVSAQTGFRDDAAAFVKLLLAGSSAEGVPCYVLLTMRSDYLGDCAQFRDLPEAINRGQYLIPRMTRDERRSAITGPVAVGGGVIAPRLVSRILNDVGDEPDQLPILQHALMRAWDHWRHAPREGEPLDLRHYEEVGGAQEALSRHAEEAYADLDARGRELAEKVFRRLTERGPDNRDIRRPTRFGELCAVVNAGPGEVAAVVDVFRRPGRSFLMPPADVPLEPETLVDISHESLIRGWDLLRKWVEKEAEAAKQYRRLADTAMLWKAGRAGLLQDPELSHVLEWWDHDRPGQAWGSAYHPGFQTAAEFLERSREERDRELQRERQREAAKRRARQLAVAALVVGLVFTTALSAVAWRQAQRARVAEAGAIAARDAARTAQADADHKRGLAVQAQQVAAAALDSLAKAVIAKEAEARRADEAAAEARRQLARALQAEKAAQEAADAALIQLARAMSAERRTQNEQMAGLGTVRGVLVSAQEDARLGSVPSLLSQEAWTLSNLGLQREAERSYSNALRFNPLDPGTLINRSDTYLNLGKPDSALADLEVVLELEPNDFLARLNTAVARMMLGDYDAAAQNFRSAIDATQYGVIEAGQPLVSPEIQRTTSQRTLTLAPHEVSAALRFALASTRAHDPQGSLSFVDSLEAADRQEAWSMNALLNPLNWLWLSRKEGGWTQVRDYGQFAAEGALWERVGWSKDMRGKGEFAHEAARSYCRFRRLHADRREERYERLAGWVHSRLATIQRSGCSAVELDPPPIAEALEDLMISARRHQARDSLLAVDSLYTLALRRASAAERPHLLLDRGWTRHTLGFQSGDRAARRRYFRAAESDADSALALQPRLATAYFLRGRAKYDEAAWEGRLGDQGMVADILTDLNTALAYQPTMTSALFTRGWTLDWLDAREAAASLREGLRFSPENPEFWAALALREMTSGEYAAAEEAANVAVRLEPSSLRFHEIAEAVRLRLPADSLQSGRVSQRVAWKFRQLAEASQVLGEPLRAEYFYLASLREFAEAAVAGAAGLDEELLEAGRRYRCIYRVHGAREDPRRRLAGEPSENVEWPSQQASSRAVAVLREVDGNFDPRTCTAPATAGGP